jgi:hypothetical protein
MRAVEKTELRETYQGWRVPATIRSDRAVCGREHEAYIKKAETKREAIKQVEAKDRVVNVHETETESLRVNSEGLRIRRADVPTLPDKPNGVVLLDGDLLNRVGESGHPEQGSVTGRGRIDGEVVDVTVEWSADKSSLDVSAEWPNGDLSAAFAEDWNATPECGTGRVFVLDCIAGKTARVEVVPEDEWGGEKA